MDLSTLKSYGNGETFTPVANKPSLQQGENGFAVMLDATAMKFDASALKFSGSSTLPTATNSLNAAFAKAPVVEAPAKPKPREHAEKHDRPEDKKHIDTRPADAVDDGRDRGVTRNSETTTDTGDQGDISQNDHQASQDQGRRDTGKDNDGTEKFDVNDNSAQSADLSTNQSSDAQSEAVGMNAAAEANVAAQANNQSAQAAQALNGQAQQAAGAAMAQNKAADNANVKSDAPTIEVKATVTDTSANALQTGLSEGPERKDLMAGRSGAEAAQNAADQAQSKAAKAQAEELAQSLAGTVNRANIKVEVSNNAATGSQPTANLAQGALLADEAFDGFNNQPAGTNTEGAGGNGTFLNNNGAKGQNPFGQNAQAQANMANAAQANVQQAQANAQGSQGNGVNQALAGTGAGEAAQTAQAAQTVTTGGETTPQIGATQGTNQTSPTQQAAQTQQTHTPKPVYVPPQEVVDQVKVKITKALAQGNDTIKIQLKPEHLGKIEVKLELSDNGKVQALIVADSKETLDMLKQDARGLENALKDAGLKADPGCLSFEHREEGQASLFAKDSGAEGNADGADDGDAGVGAEDTADNGDDEVGPRRNIIEDDHVDAYI